MLMQIKHKVNVISFVRQPHETQSSTTQNIHLKGAGCFTTLTCSGTVTLSFLCAGSLFAASLYSLAPTATPLGRGMRRPWMGLWI